ncbi:MAG: hypothetical protein KAW41_00755 [Candidatus Diapherotrites archaeon]|nr:hypothetical protein [Candidatus Diapherotrites archaeon]
MEKFRVRRQFKKNRISVTIHQMEYEKDTTGKKKFSKTFKLKSVDGRHIDAITSAIEEEGVGPGPSAKLFFHLTSLEVRTQVNEAIKNGEIAMEHKFFLFRKPLVFSLRGKYSELIKEYQSKQK